MQYALVRGDEVLRAPSAWVPRAFALAVQGAGVSVSLGDAVPQEAIVLQQGPPALRIVPVEDPPAYDAALSTCAWSVETGQWAVRHRAVADMQAALVDRSRHLCRAGILALADEEEQRNAALGLLSVPRIAAIKTSIAAWRTAHAAHQAAIEALDDQADLAGYDLSTGWPS